MGLFSWGLIEMKKVDVGNSCFCLLEVVSTWLASVYAISAGPGGECQQCWCAPLFNHAKCLVTMVNSKPFSCCSKFDPLRSRVPRVGQAARLLMDIWFNGRALLPVYGNRDGERKKRDQSQQHMLLWFSSFFPIHNDQWECNILFDAGCTDKS